MVITHRINMDFQLRGPEPVVNVVQDDKYSRNLEFVLFSNGTSWEPPAGTVAVVRYHKPDGHGGTYDTLPDGSAACVISENIVTAILAPQVTTVSGPVFFSVTLVLGEAELSTFSVTIQVQHSPNATAVPDGDYVSVSGLLPGPAAAAVGQYLKVLRVNDAGKVTALEAVDDPVGDINAVLDAINGEVL